MLSICRCDCIWPGILIRAVVSNFIPVCLLYKPANHFSPLFAVLPATPVSEYGSPATAIKNVAQATENEIKTDDKKVQAARTVGTDAQQVTVHLPSHLLLSTISI